MKTSLLSAGSPERSPKKLDREGPIADIGFLYRQIPLEVVARHEAGHAVMAHRCGGAVKHIVVGRSESGHPCGQSYDLWVSKRKRPLVLSGGVLALYLHDRPPDLTFEGFCHWVTSDGHVLARSAGGDWAKILSLTGQPPSCGLQDDFERAVRPYFDQTIALLTKDLTQLDRLTELVMTQPPGIGRRTLKRFFAGRPRSRWAERLDRSSVLWAAQAVVRERRHTPHAPPYVAPHNQM